MKPRKATTRTTKRGKDCQPLARLGKQSLPASEWAFHKVPPAEWDAVARYEYEREAAEYLDTVPDTIGHPLADALRGQLHTDANAVELATNIYLFCAKDEKRVQLPAQRAWLDLSKKERSEVLRDMDYRMRLTREHTLAPIEEVTSNEMPLPAFIESVTFNVDWRAKDEPLRAAFAAWLESANRAKRGAQFRPGKARTGPSPLLSALTDLVIMRGRRAGMTLRQTADLMAPFLCAAGASGKANNPVQRARACQLAEQRIRSWAAAWFLGMDRFRAILHRITGEAPAPHWFLHEHHRELRQWVDAKRSAGHVIPAGDLFIWEQTGDLDRLNRITET